VPPFRLGITHGGPSFLGPVKFAVIHHISGIEDGQAFFDGYFYQVSQAFSFQFDGKLSAVGFDRFNAHPQMGRDIFGGAVFSQELEYFFCP
jgi:hypothetical protein